MLQAVGRLLDQCGTLLPDANPIERFACARAAHLLSRYAFAADGLGELAAGFVADQQSLADVVGLTLAAGLDHRAYAANRGAIDAALAERARHGQSETLDGLFATASDIDYRFTKARGEAEKQASAAWRAARGPVTDIIDASRLTSYLRRRFSEYPAITATDVARLGGINANEAYFCTIDGHPDWPREIVLRRMLPADIQPRSLTEEYDILIAMQDRGLPIPRPLFCDEAGNELGCALIAVERLPGETRTLTDDVAGARPIFEQLAGLMARLHKLDVAILPAHRRGVDGDALRWLHVRIDQWEENWLRACDEPLPTVSNAFHWLRRHAGDFCRRQAIVHGDLDQRNLLNDGKRITALIDWEVAHQGHPAEDLAYVHDQIVLTMPWEEFTALYEAAGGDAFTDFEMRYATVLCNMLRVTTSMAAYRAFVAGNIDNVLIGTIRTIETEQACQLLHAAIYD